MGMLLGFLFPDQTPKKYNPKALERIQMIHISMSVSTGVILRLPQMTGPQSERGPQRPSLSSSYQTP